MLAQRLDKFLQSPVDTIELEDFTELFSEITPVLRVIRPILNKVDQIRLSYLLKGVKRGRDLDTSISKLYNYVSTPKRAEYVSTVFRHALLSNSHLVNTIMGLQLSTLTENDTEISQADLVIYDALVSFNDFDVLNYKYIYEETQNHPFNTDSGICINDEVLKNYPNHDDIQMTIRKSERAGLFIYLPSASYDSDGMHSFAVGSFYLLTETSTRFYNMICEAGVLIP